MQNGVTAADIAEASGHKDLSKELMPHSLSPQDVRHNEDDVSYSISIGIDYIQDLFIQTCSSRLAIPARGLDLVQAAHCMCTCDSICCVASLPLVHYAITFLLL